MPRAKPPNEETVLTEHRYYERGDRFWEIWLAGPTSVRTRAGKIGGDGQTKVKDFAKEWEATRELRKAVARKLADGFEPRVKGATLPAPKTNAALERAIVANPYDEAAYMVYADWLQSEGDPRGELIALMRADGPKGKKGQKFLEANLDYFLGTLKDHQKCHDAFEPGALGYRAGIDRAFTWKHGFIYAARLAHNQHATRWRGRLATDVLAPLLAHPSGKFLVELTINENDDPTEGSIEDLIDVLAQRARPTIRKLQIGDEISQLSWYRPGNLAKLWKAVPNLTHFGIQAGEFELGTIELPHLVRAVFYTGGLSRSAARSIAKARWPKIEHLEVYFGDSNYGADTTLDDALPLLARTDMPALRHLAVKNAEFQDELVEAVAKSKLLRQLEVLDLSDGILTDAAVEIFAKYKTSFAHLKSIDVSDTYLTKDGAKKLKSLLKQVDVTDVRGGDEYDEDPEWRYVRVGE